MVSGTISLPDYNHMEQPQNNNKTEYNRSNNNNKSNKCRDNDDDPKLPTSPRPPSQEPMTKINSLNTIPDNFTTTLDFIHEPENPSLVHSNHHSCLVPTIQPSAQRIFPITASGDSGQSTQFQQFETHSGQNSFLTHFEPFAHSTTAYNSTFQPTYTSYNDFYTTPSDDMWNNNDQFQPQLLGSNTSMIDSIPQPFDLFQTSLQSPFDNAPSQWYNPNATQRVSNGILQPQPCLPNSSINETDSYAFTSHPQQSATLAVESKQETLQLESQPKQELDQTSPSAPHSPLLTSIVITSTPSNGFKANDANVATQTMGDIQQPVQDGVEKAVQQELAPSAAPLPPFTVPSTEPHCATKRPVAKKAAPKDKNQASPSSRAKSKQPNGTNDGFDQAESLPSAPSLPLDESSSSLSSRPRRATRSTSGLVGAALGEEDDEVKATTAGKSGKGKGGKNNTRSVAPQIPVETSSMVDTDRPTRRSTRSAAAAAAAVVAVESGTSHKNATARKQPNDDEEDDDDDDSWEERQRYREKNRISAQKSRERKREQIIKDQEHFERCKKENETLKLRVAQLEEQVRLLTQQSQSQAQVRDHGNGHDHDLFDENGSGNGM